MKTLSREQLLELHQPHWSGTWTWMGFAIAFSVVEGLLLLTLLFGPGGAAGVALVVVLTLVVSHLMHAHLIAFHEAAHGTLSPSPWVNDFFGLHVSLFNLMSLSLYRAAHHSHHAYLATERDEELWPFVVPGTSRWARRLAAFAEMTCGMIFTPLLFFRAFLRPGTVIRDPKVRRRIWIEQIAILVLWLAIVAAVAWLDLWKFWLVMYLVPTFLAGNMQSVRKYIEHMGLSGATPLSATRSVLSPGLSGRVVAFCLFNEPYHGAHHKYAQLPQGALPQVTSALTPTTPDELPPYLSYRRALWDMLLTLRDPRIGKQWLGAETAVPERGATA